MAITSNTYVANRLASLYPAVRGSQRCFARGEVVEMCGNYGWLAAFAHIDHPHAAKHQGHIYVQKCDIADKDQLVAGDIVTFYLYVDARGLGAEYCRREELARPAILLNECLSPQTTSIEPPPGLEGRTWKVLSSPPGLDCPCSESNSQPMQTPSWFGGGKSLESNVAKFGPSTSVFAPLTACNSNHGWTAAALEFFSDDDDDSDCSSSSGDDDVPTWDSKLNAVVMSTSKHCGGSDTDPLSKSTCDGESSDSDWEANIQAQGAVPIRLEQALGMHATRCVKPPPGRWVKPPPGLSLYD